MLATRWWWTARSTTSTCCPAGSSTARPSPSLVSARRPARLPGACPQPVRPVGAPGPEGEGAAAGGAPTLPEGTEQACVHVRLCRSARVCACAHLRVSVPARVCGCDGPGFLLCGWSQPVRGRCASPVPCARVHAPLCSPLPPALTLALSAGTRDILVPLTDSHLQDWEDLSLSSSVSLSPYLCSLPISLSPYLSLPLCLPPSVCVYFSPPPSPCSQGLTAHPGLSS